MRMRRDDDCDINKSRVRNLKKLKRDDEYVVSEFET